MRMVSSLEDTQKTPWRTPLEDTMEDIPGGHPWRTPPGGHLGVHPGRTLLEDTLEDTLSTLGKYPWRTPLEDTP
jgi:hypothetical protein